MFQTYFKMDFKLIKQIFLSLHKPLLFFIKTKELPNLPSRYILACNHPSYMDGFLIYLFWYFKYKTKLSIFAYEKYFNKWCSGFYLRLVNCIKVEKRNPGNSLKIAFKSKKKSFCIFIEGKRTKKKSKPRTGCIRLGLFHKIPIIPVKIINKGFKKEIIIGKEVSLNGKNIRKQSQQLLETIYNLS